MMTEILKQSIALVTPIVQEWSDFKIQRTNPCDPKYFEEDEVGMMIVRKLKGKFPRLSDEDILKNARGALLNAMDQIKKCRIVAMTWNPYGSETV